MTITHTQQIPILVPPIEDELLFSYLIRLGAANGFLSLSQFANAYLWPNTSAERRNRILVSYDANKEFSGFLRAGFPSADPVRFYLDHSIYSAVSPFLTRWIQTKIVNNAFRPEGQVSKLNETVNSMNPQLQWCPECEKEDRKQYGTRIYYRKHNLPGVTVCPIHHVPLRIYKDSRTNISDANTKSSVCDVKDMDVAVKYSEYAVRLLESCLDLDVQQFSDAVFRKLKECGLYGSGYVKLTEAVKAEKLDTCFPRGVEHFMQISMISPAYINKEACIALCLLLFPNPMELQEYAGRDADKIIRFIDACGSDYSVFEPFRMNILEMEKASTGERFVTTVDGFLSMWREYSADNGKSSRQKFEEVFAAVQDGSYSLLEPFNGMDTPIKMLHTACGKILKMKPRQFIEDGSRCQCEHTVSFEQAKNRLREKAPEFTLISFQGTDKEAAFMHNKCGQSFTRMFRSFLDHPNCPYCSISHLKKSEDMFKKQIWNLTGDEYSLVGPYVDKDTKVKIRHNKCGRVFERLPRHFLDDGQRCPDCTREISDAKFSELAKTISKGRYVVSGRKRANTYEIIDNETGASLYLVKKKAMQELLRPTPSDILPLNEKATAEMPVTMEDRIMAWLREHYSSDALIFLDDIHIEGVLYSSLKARVTSLVKKGKLFRAGFGILSFKPIHLSDDTLIKEKYLVRHGHREGILFGASLAYELGVVEAKPLTMQIMTNRESSGTGGRTKKIGNVTVRLRGSEYLITDLNYKTLAAIELFAGQFHYGWEVDKIRQAVIDLGVREEDVTSYEKAMSSRTRKVCEAVFRGMK